jgi:D-tyrosyl-tRNA(Tyr) deacylase
MKIVIQRVSNAKVEVEGTTVGSIGLGVLVLVGITHNDTIEQVTWLANKLVNLRIFEDTQGKMNLSLLECNGEALIISQFTLYADATGGRRPSFTRAAQPELAKQLYEKFIEAVQKEGVKVQTGIFGADMKVSLLNDGPVTLILER